jgi:hypothetical protein
MDADPECERIFGTELRADGPVPARVPNTEIGSVAKDRKDRKDRKTRDLLAIPRRAWSFSIFLTLWFLLSFAANDFPVWGYSSPTT